MFKMKAIIFDMDGVLIDSPKYVWKSFNIILGEEGVHIGDEIVKKYLGKRLKDQLQMWKEDFKIKDHNIEDFSKRAGELELGFYKKELNDLNVKNIIVNLKKSGFKLALATSSLKWRADKILNILKIKDYFKVMITAEDVEKGKPNPEMFLKAAEKLNVKSEECVVIEDAVNGIQAAKNAGMKTIALLTKFHTQKEFKDADLIISSLDELNENLIKNL